MNNLLILLVQSKLTASFEIIAMLLIAVIIGFVTAWLYNNSIYRIKINVIKSELNNHKNQLVALIEEKNNMHHILDEKEKKIRDLERDVTAIKALNSKALHETDELTVKNKKREQKLQEKDEALASPAHDLHLLDYNSFGTAREEEKDDLKMISGIGSFIEEKLHALNIYTFSQISKFTSKDIETIDEAIEFFSGRIKRDEWIAQAKELVYNEQKQAELLQRIKAKKSLIYYNRISTAIREEADDLTEISGIGGWINEKLNALDIYTFRQIANFSQEDIELVTEATEYFPGRIERDEWVHQARELILIEISMSEHLEQISIFKNRIYYDRLGIAHKHHANNLTLIQGISQWIEERLNKLEIYTFKQIKNLKTEDIEIISDILDISPNRIRQDRWVEQALELTEKSKKNVA